MWVCSILNDIPYIGWLVTGDCPTGADRIALVNAEKHRPDLVRQSMKADWSTHGLQAGPIRNMRVAGECEILFAFWDGKVEGSGTLDVVRKARALDKPVVIFWDRSARL